MHLASAVTLVFWWTQAPPVCQAPAELSKPETARAHNTLGAWFAERQQFACAIPSFESAIRLDHSLWEARYNLALAQTAAGNLSTAEDHLKAAAKLAPDSAAVLFQLGQVLLAQRRFSAATHYLRQALKQSPESFETRLALLL